MSFKLTKQSAQTLHRMSFQNRKHVECSRIVGCFYCCKLFDSNEIEEWCDEQQTALCPHCGIDAVLYSTALFPVSEELLKEMSNLSFSLKE